MLKDFEVTIHSLNAKDVGMVSICVRHKRTDRRLYMACDVYILNAFRPDKSAGFQEWAAPVGVKASEVPQAPALRKFLEFLGEE